MKNEIRVSICCSVYNHEKYLRQCLDSLLMQETNFRYEILIHDDASTDSSTEIIREYESKFPDIIKPIYQTENQYSKGVKISWEYQYPRAKGKYLAWCEGDDFWSDPKKLQFQYDALEQHPECSFCAHIVQSVFEDGKPMEEVHPNFELKEGILNSDKWMEYLLGKSVYLFQTSSYFMRKEVLFNEKNGEIPEFVKVASVGDYPLMMLAALNGNVYYIKKGMSCYRKQSISSWTLKVYQDNRRRIACSEYAIESYKLYKEFSHHKYDKYVDMKIARDEFNIFHLKGEYKKLLDSKYKFFMSQQTLKEKSYIYIFAYMPWLQQPYEKFKKFFRKYIKGNE